jgi:hypothetical protein
VPRLLYYYTISSFFLFVLFFRSTFSGTNYSDRLYYSNIPRLARVQSSRRRRNIQLKKKTTPLKCKLKKPKIPDDIKGGTIPPPPPSMKFKKIKCLNDPLRATSCFSQSRCHQKERKKNKREASPDHIIITRPKMKLI